MHKAQCIMHNESGVWDSFVIFFSNNWDNPMDNWHNNLLDCMESWNRWNQTTFTTWEQLLQLVISQSCTWRCRKACLRRNYFGLAWNQTTATTDKLLSQLIGGFRWNHGISGIKQFLQTGNNSYNWSSRKVAPGGVAKPACAGINGLRMVSNNFHNL